MLCTYLSILTSLKGRLLNGSFKVILKHSSIFVVFPNVIAGLKWRLRFLLNVALLLTVKVKIITFDDILYFMICR